MLITLLISSLIGIVVGGCYGFFQRPAPSREWLLGSEARVASRSSFKVLPSWLAGVLELFLTHLFAAAVFLSIACVVAASLFVARARGVQPGAPIVVALVLVLCGIAIGRSLRKRGAG